MLFLKKIIALSIQALLLLHLIVLISVFSVFSAEKLRVCNPKQPL